MNDPKTLEEAYDRVIFEARELFLAKQNDYGPDNIDAFKEKGCVVRAYDKISRLKRLVWFDNTAQVKEEGISDTWIDLANYAIIAMLLRKGWWGLPVDDLENRTKPTKPVSDLSDSR